MLPFMQVTVSKLPMKELISFFVLVVGFLLIILSFFSIEPRKTDLRKLGLGSLMMLSVIGYFLWSVFAPPTSGEIEEETRDKPITVVATLKEKLDESIYAYDYPGWAIAKELAQCSSDVFPPWSAMSHLLAILR